MILLYTVFMDMKKKIEETYNPDKQARREKVVVGLSGGLDSLVITFLLKIQKYDLIAVTIDNRWEDFPGDQNKILSCHNTPAKIEMLKEFCHKLGIPLQVVKANAEFQENVIGPWIGDRILGRLPKPCWSCHANRMTILHQKMKEFGASSLATGHFAKLFRNDTHQSVFVHTSNDEEYDQSSLLSGLSHEILSSLILPLSDLTKKEVLKLAENFGLGELNNKIAMHRCLPWTEEVATIFEKRVPKKMLKPGEMTNRDNTVNFGAHNGVQSHVIGEELEYRDNGKLTKAIFGEFSYLEKRMIFENEDQLFRDKFLMTKCQFSEEVSWVEPLKGFVKLSSGMTVECWIYPKPLDTVYIELMIPQLLLNGAVVTVMKKQGRNSKIYLIGTVQLLAKDVVNQEGESNVQKAIYSVDF